MEPSSRQLRASFPGFSATKLGGKEVHGFNITFKTSVAWKNGRGLQSTRSCQFFAPWAFVVMAVVLLGFAGPWSTGWFGFMCPRLSKQNINISTSEVWHFDDRSENIVGFRGTGMNARQVSCATRWGAHQRLNNFLMVVAWFGMVGWCRMLEAPIAQGLHRFTHVHTKGEFPSRHPTGAQIRDQHEDIGVCGGVPQAESEKSWALRGTVESDHQRCVSNVGVK